MSLTECIRNKGNIKTFEKLLKTETLEECTDGWTPLMWAIFYYLPGHVKLLLKAGANPNKPDWTEQTPIMLSTAYDFCDISELLINYNADVTCFTNRGYIPIILIASTGCVKCTHMLIKAGADVETKDEEYRTPLCMAIERSRHLCAELLLDKGADMRNVPAKLTNIEWVKRLFCKRQNALSSTQAFLRVLRKMFRVPCESTLHIQNHIPKDVATLLARYLWETRFDKIWE